MNETQIFNKLLELGSMNQSKLAKEMGVTPQYIVKWKTGQAKPSMKKLHKIAGILGLEIEVVVKG